MVQWPEAWQQKLIEALGEVGADRPCPRCGHADFDLLDGYVALPVQVKLTEPTTTSLPTVVTVCERCGFIAQHAVRVLLAADLTEGEEESGAAAPERPGEARGIADTAGA